MVPPLFPAMLLAKLLAALVAGFGAALLAVLLTHLAMLLAALLTMILGRSRQADGERNHREHGGNKQLSHSASPLEMKKTQSRYHCARAMETGKIRDFGESLAGRPLRFQEGCVAMTA